MGNNIDDLKQSKTTDVTDSENLKKKDENLRAQKIANDTSESELELKKKICSWVQIVVSIYLALVALAIGLLALSYMKLSDNVVIVLLTTTTINILGLPYMIIKSLFPANK